MLTVSVKKILTFDKHVEI